MLEINYKQIYEVEHKENNEWVLILYDISANHYVGTPIYSKNNVDLVHLESIDKYINPSIVRDYDRSHMKKCIYVNGKPLKISNEDFRLASESCKNSLIKYLDTKTNANNTEDLSFLKWCKDKFILNSKDIKLEKVKQTSIYWVNLGVNVGSELRKLRPAIMWRCSSDKKMWTVIPLTTKKRNDNYYFHYDLENGCGTARIENMINISHKRIVSPFYFKDKIAKISNEDCKNIIKIIQKFYTFANDQDDDN